MRYAKTILPLLAAALVLTPASAGTAHNSKYESIQVMRFNVGPGSQLPQDYFAAMMEEMVTQLNRTHRFQQVLCEGETPAQPAQTIQVQGTVTRFNKGNRAVRYMVGFGAGKTKIVAHVKFVDSATGAVQLEKNVDGKVWIGFMGGESMNATKGLAKEVAKVARKNF